MARCYHDEHDFQSNLKIEVAIEDDIIQEEQDLDNFPCKKNPGHSGFIPIKDLEHEDIPEEIRTPGMILHIKSLGYQVVRIVVDMKDGSPVRSGTGQIVKVGNTICIQTTKQVVKTDKEVKNCTVDFYYDYPKDKRSYEGEKLITTCPSRDTSIFALKSFMQSKEDNVPSSPNIVIVKNDNEPKMYSSGIRYYSNRLVHYTSTDLNDPNIYRMCVSLPNNSISYLKSSYVKFQPVNDDVKDLTSIKLHIDEIDGKRRVLRGDVVKSGDEYVVKISKPIFQDQVKKYSLVWKGEVISRGTRLFFERIESSTFLKGIDENVSETAPPIWLFDFYPPPKVEEAFNYLMIDKSFNEVVCCIGHPHGGVKMVSFGRTLGRAVKRFDIHGRCIDHPGKDCKCQEIECVQYSCTTCPGSSGSPVFVLNDEYERAFHTCNVTHCMGENSEYANNVNIAWR